MLTHARSGDERARHRRNRHVKVRKSSSSVATHARREMCAQSREIDARSPQHRFIIAQVRVVIAARGAPCCSAITRGVRARRRTRAAKIKPSIEGSDPRSTACHGRTP
jgi:hypothetical protein